ncbi:MAG: hypothetical protein Q4F40_01890 [Akkermansia sp.]|nr:hypothetical protein [Akkermansia sp.]
MCSRPAIDAASVRIELKPRLPWYGIFALLLFALFMLSFAAWLFFGGESAASALWVPCVALVMGVAMVGTLLYLLCGRKYLLMSREETLYILRFLGYSCARSFSTRQLHVEVRRSEWEESGENPKVTVSFEVHLSSLGTSLKLAEFPREEQALSLCKQIESQRAVLLGNE